MKYALWVLQILLCVQFAFGGSFKLLTPREQLVANPMGAWANDFSAAQIRLIGVAEIAGAIGLVVPVATGILPVLTPLAAGGLAVLMGGAVLTHIRRGELFAYPLVLGVLAAFVAWGRIRMGTRAPA
jgi:hypothetical protein